MKAHTASAINAYTLVVMGLLGFWATKGPDQSPTVWIPVAFGVILLVLNNGIKYQHKVQSHIAVILTLLITIALIKPLQGRIADADTWGIVRVGLELLTSVIAMIFFIKSFSDARKKG